MNRCSLAIAVLLAIAGAIRADAADRLRFWNLTSNTISQLYLAPAGSTNWGPNQCANDKDGTVDPDERLLLRDVAAGRYDVKLTDTTGRSCIVRGVTVEAGKTVAFSLGENDLKDCSKASR